MPETHAITIAFASVAATPNQKATAGRLDSLSFGNPVHDAVVVLDGPNAQKAFDQLSGEIHGSGITALIGNSGKVRSILSRRFQSAFANGQAATSFPLTSYASWGSAAEQASGSGYSAWGQVFGSWGRTSGDGNATSLRHDDGGFLVGADAILAETWSVGAFAGYSRSTFSANDRNSSGSSDNFHLGFHAGTEIGALRLNVGAAHTWHDLDTRRSVAFPGLTDRLSASYDARTVQGTGSILRQNPCTAPTPLPIVVISTATRTAAGPPFGDDTLQQSTRSALTRGSSPPCSIGAG